MSQGNQSTLPSRLKKSPLAETVFEVRFAPANDAVVSLLPGLVFAKLGSEYTRAESLPLASLPREIRAAQPDFRYQQQIRLSGTNTSIFIGDAVAGVSQVSPYGGWKQFQPRLHAFLDVLQQSSLVRSVERISMKAVNVLPVPQGQQLAALKLRVDLAGKAVPESGFRLRTELHDSKFARIIEVATNALIHPVDQSAVDGLLLSLDCIHVHSGSVDFWPVAKGSVEDVHVELKKLFFSVISDDMLATLEPEY